VTALDVADCVERHQATTCVARPVCIRIGRRSATAWELFRGSKGVAAMNKCAPPSSLTEASHHNYNRGAF